MVSYQDSDLLRLVAVVAVVLFWRAEPEQGVFVPRVASWVASLADLPMVFSWEAIVLVVAGV